MKVELLPHSDSHTLASHWQGWSGGRGCLEEGGRVGLVEGSEVRKEEGQRISGGWCPISLQIGPTVQIIEHMWQETNLRTANFNKRFRKVVPYPSKECIL